MIRESATLHTYLYRDKFFHNCGWCLAHPQVQKKSPCRQVVSVGILVIPMPMVRPSFRPATSCVPIVGRLHRLAKFASPVVVRYGVVHALQQYRRKGPAIDAKCRGQKSFKGNVIVGDEKKVKNF